MEPEADELKPLEENRAASFFELKGKIGLVEWHSKANALGPDSMRLLESAVDYASGHLRGLVIHTKKFPGWDSLAGMLGHFRFVRNHHRKLAHVALVTDSPLGDLAEKRGGHFVSAEIRHFDYDDLDEARAWIIGG